MAEQDAWIVAPIGPQAFSHAIGIVDATYVRIQRPKNTQQERRLYSTYKKYHAVFFLAIIDRTGQLQHAAAGEGWLADCVLIIWSAILLRPLPRCGRWQSAHWLCRGNCLRSCVPVAASSACTTR